MIFNFQPSANTPFTPAGMAQRSPLSTLQPISVSHFLPTDSRTTRSGRLHFTITRGGESLQTPFTSLLPLQPRKIRPQYAKEAKRPHGGAEVAAATKATEAAARSSPCELREERAHDTSAQRAFADGNSTHTHRELPGPRPLPGE